MKLKPELLGGSIPITVKIFILQMILVLTGCVAYQLPENYHIETSSGLPFIDRLAVKTGRYTHYLKPHFEKSVNSTGVVGQIVEYPATSDETLIADLNDTTGGACFSEPYLMVLTVGIIPEIGCVEVGYVFDLHDPKNKQTVTINSRYIGKAIGGWAALFYLPFDNWVGRKELTSFEDRQLGIEIQKAVQKLNANANVGDSNFDNAIQDREK